MWQGKEIMQSDITNAPSLEGGHIRPGALNIFRVTDFSENV